MRGIRLLAFVAACVTAASCSSNAIMGGTGGQNGGGDGGSGAGGSGAGGNTGTIDGGPKDGGQAGSGGKAGAGGQGTGGEFAATGGKSGAGGQSGAGGSDCSPACAASAVCVGTGIQGGVIFFADGGVCPPGRHVENNFCVQDLTFTCMPIPSGCNGTSTCACASSLCNTDGSAGRVCATPRAGELTCVQQVP